MRVCRDVKIPRMGLSKRFEIGEIMLLIIRRKISPKIKKKGKCELVEML